MSEQSTAATGASAPAPGATVAEGSAQPAELGAEQQAALKEIDRMRGEYGNTPSDKRDALTQKISKLQRFAFGHGDKPADFMPGDPPPPDLREHDSLRDTFEQMAQPASEQQTKAAVNNAVIQGVDRALAQKAADVCTVLGLSEGLTRNVLDRVRAHHGATHGHSSEADVAILADHEMPEYVNEAARFFGSSQKLKEVSVRAREFLQSRGLLEKFDKSGLTRSTLAFDPKLLHTLAQAAERAGVPRGGKQK